MDLEYWGLVLHLLHQFHLLTHLRPAHHLKDPAGLEDDNNLDDHSLAIFIKAKIALNLIIVLEKVMKYKLYSTIIFISVFTGRGRICRIQS